jgi:peptidoglycan/xylan/chitin deacetylase (PgdA/CDA1 family)
VSFAKIRASGFASVSFTAILCLAAGCTTAPADTATQAAIECPAQIPAWTSGMAARSGDVVSYQDEVYRCLQTHTARADWTPDATVALWEPVQCSAPSDNLAATAPLTGNGCAGGTCLNPTCKANGTPVAIGKFPDTGFDTRPAYIPNDVIIPTFDDVPDGANTPPDPVYGPGNWTKSDLAFFKKNQMHPDMFINTNNWCGDITQDPSCEATLVDILKNENAGNHTVHHIHMGIAGTPSDPGCPDAPSCSAEVAGVESLVKTLSNGGRPHLTRFRAPYGEPFQAQGPGLSMVEAVVAKFAVQVGWNFDSGDSSCDSTTAPCFTGQQIANNVIQHIGSGPGKGQGWGIVLMHGTYPWTRDALPILFGSKGYLAKHGFKIGTVEDAICWKYGKHSWQIVQQLTGKAHGPN